MNDETRLAIVVVSLIIVSIIAILHSKKKSMMPYEEETTIPVTEERLDDAYLRLKLCLEKELAKPKDEQNPWAIEFCQIKMAEAELDAIRIHDSFPTPNLEAIAPELGYQISPVLPDWAKRKRQ